MNKPLCLVILDGWGFSESPEHNAILNADTPTWDRLWAEAPHCLISCSGKDVGLPAGQMGNSEVGHLTMGAGRVVLQDLCRVDHAITTGEFEANPVFLEAIDQSIQNNKAIHIIGLLSPGGVHSHEQHIFSLIKLAASRGLKKIYIHAILDGRDMPPKSAQASIEKCLQYCQNYNAGTIASICGRYYAMDRDKRHERTLSAFNTFVTGTSEFKADTALDALEQAYTRGETDEFVQPTVMRFNERVSIQSGDRVFFMNFRSDRMRQLSQAFVNSGPKNVSLISLTQYAKDIPTTIAFPQQTIHNHLGQVLSDHQLKQLRVAETEKYAHVTFFFNGGVDEPYPGEERSLIASPKVSTYDKKPEMSASAITNEIIKAIQQQKVDVIIANFANADMVGHTGNFNATIKAIETLDSCLARLVETLEQYHGEMLITADHGNAECMYNAEHDQAHTAHTTNPIPVIYYGRPAKMVPDLKGSLADIAPTLLYLLNQPIPDEMKGHSLIQLKD